MNNEVIFLLVSLGAALALTWAINAGLKFFIPKLSQYASHTRARWDDILLNCLLLTKKWFIFLWIFIPLLMTGGALAADEKLAEVVKNAGRLLLVLGTSAQLIIWGLNIINQWKTKNTTEKKGTATPAMGLLYTTLQGLLVVAIVLIALSNLGINIGALVTGLGIGGIAVALAAQNVLGDFLASLSIVLDKPFENGDYIVVGSEEGSVEDIGVKTTRVRSISGEELIFSNKDLLESRIRNYKRMWRRRVSHEFTISLSTPVEKVAEVSKWIKSKFPKYPKLTFDRCHFVGFGDSNLKFQLVFWVEDANHAVYMDLQEKLLLDIFAQLATENIKIAMPTTSLRLDGDRAAKKEELHEIKESS